MQAFLDALKSGDLAEAERLLDQHPALLDGRNEQGASWLATALYHGRPEIARLFLDRGRHPDLHEAAMLGRTEIVRHCQTDIDALSPDGFPALSLAVFFGHPSTFEALLEMGANVHTQSRNPMQVRPIHAAAARRDHVAVQALLTRGADPNAPQSHGFTALHTAAANNDQRLAELLLQAGADRLAQNTAGHTPADLARAQGHSALASYLDAY